MKIRLDEGDISALRYIRTHPAREHHNHGLDRYVSLGLVESCKGYLVEESKRQALVAARQLKKALAKTKLPDRRNVSDQGLKQKWEQIKDLTYKMTIEMFYSTAKGHRLTARGAELLRTIDESIKAAKWSVDKDVTLEIDV